MGRKTGVSEEGKGGREEEGRPATRASHAVCHRQFSHPSPAGAAPRGAVSVPSHSIPTSYTDPPNLGRFIFLCPHHIEAFDLTVCVCFR